MRAEVDNRDVVEESCFGKGNWSCEDLRGKRKNREGVPRRKLKGTSLGANKTQCYEGGLHYATAASGLGISVVPKAS